MAVKNIKTARRTSTTKSNMPKTVTMSSRQPHAAVKKEPIPSKDTIIQLANEFVDRSRKTIQTWRNAMKLAERPDDPRWYMFQDLLDDVTIDGHYKSVVEVRKTATLNHPFYVYDKVTKEHLDEQTEFLNAKWFYNYLEEDLNATFRKYTILQFFRDGDKPRFDVIPRRNVCPQLKRIYTEVNGGNYINYDALPNVIEIIDNSEFGITNDIIANLIWKRNLEQSNAEFSERYGMPLITATTANKAEVPRIEQGLKNLGEAGTGVLPIGSNIEVHPLANAGNPEKVYLDPAKFHDYQVSKRIVGSTTMVDEGANRSQTEVHAETLDDKLSAADKRMITFDIQDKLFHVLQMLGFPFDNSRMGFKFDVTESITLKEQWDITSEALQHYDLDEKVIADTFNLPILGKKTPSVLNTGFSANFQ